MLTLYYAPGSCALASLLTLEVANAKYDLIHVDFKSRQQKSPDYLEVNPKGRVPALRTDHGTLTETPAILLYIAQTHPDANLAPNDDPFALAKVNEFNSYLCSTVHVAHAHGRRAYRWADDKDAIAAMRAKVPQNLSDCFDLIDRTMLKGPWVMGEMFSICDPYLFTLTSWLRADGVDMLQFPNVTAHHNRMLSDERVVRLLTAHAR